MTVIAEPEQAAYEPFAEETPGRNSVAAILRQARVRAGHDLRDVSAILRIRYAHLEAIEEGRFNDLPGSVYAIGFVRTYADLLDLDSDEIVRRFKDEVAGIDTQTELNFPAPVPEGRMPGGAIILIAMLLAAVAYGGWYYLSSKNQTVADLVPDLPARFAALLGDETGQAPVIEGPGDVAAPAGAPEIVVPPSPETAVRASLAAERPAAATLPEDAEPPLADGPAPAPVMAPEPAVTAETPANGTSMAEAQAAEAQTAEVPVGDVGVTEEPAPAEPLVAADASRDDIAALPVPSAEEPGSVAALAPPPAPPAAPEEAAAPAVRADGILITATDQSWVQVRDADGTLVMTRVMEPGEVYEVPETDGLRMVTGNAGGIRITVGGVETPSLGGSGDVVRNIMLDGDRLLAGTAVAR